MPDNRWRPRYVDCEDGFQPYDLMQDYRGENGLAVVYPETLISGRLLFVAKPG